MEHFKKEIKTKFINSSPRSVICRPSNYKNPLDPEKVYYSISSSDDTSSSDSFIEKPSRHKKLYSSSSSSDSISAPAVSTVSDSTNFVENKGGLFDYSTRPKSMLNFDQIFKIKAHLGSGEFGDTYLITDNNDNQYALKLSKYCTVDEVEALNYFSTPDCHPNLVCYKDYFMLGNKDAILTDYIDGNNLNYTYGLTMLQIELIFLELLNILAYIHSKGYVHRDLNLGNIMINKQGQIKLIDFGISRKYSKLDEIAHDLYLLASYITEKFPEPPSQCFKNVLKSMGYDGKRKSYGYKYNISANEAADLMIKCITNKLKS